MMVAYGVVSCMVLLAGDWIWEVGELWNGLVGSPCLKDFV